MLTNQLWMLQSIFLWIFKFLWTDNLYCEPSIFIVSYSTKSSHLRLCKERISIARSCITKQIRKAISFLFTGKLINCTQPSGSWAQVLYLLELFQGFSPRYGHLSPSQTVRDGQWSLWQYHTWGPSWGWWPSCAHSLSDSFEPCIALPSLRFQQPGVTSHLSLGQA